VYVCLCVGKDEKEKYRQNLPKIKFVNISNNNDNNDDNNNDNKKKNNSSEGTTLLHNFTNKNL